MLDFPQGDIPHFSAMGGKEIHEASLFQRTRKGWAFRRIRAAGDIRARGAGMLPANQTRHEVNGMPIT